MYDEQHEEFWRQCYNEVCMNGGNQLAEIADLLMAGWRLWWHDVEKYSYQSFSRNTPSSDHWVLFIVDPILAKLPSEVELLLEMAEDPEYRGTVPIFKIAFRHDEKILWPAGKIAERWVKNHVP